MPAPAARDIAALYDAAVEPGLRAQVIALRTMIANATPIEQAGVEEAVVGARDEIVRLHTIGALSDAVAAALVRLLPADRFDTAED